MNKRPGMLMLLLPVVLLLPACAEPRPEQGEPSARESPEAATKESQETADTPKGPSTPAVLPGLFSIMTELDRNLSDLSRGMWLEDFEAIGAAARAVADHPTVPPEELEIISNALGSDLARFKAWDMEVHDRAVRTAEAASEENIGTVLEMDAGMRSGCVGCHTEFRERLRQAIR